MYPGNTVRCASWMETVRCAVRAACSAQPYRPLFRAGQPFRVLVAGAAPVGDAFAAQESAPVASPARTAPAELPIGLAVALPVQDVRAQRGGVELGGDRRQSLIIDGRGHLLPLRAVKPFAHPDVIHVIIFHARRSLQTATDARSEEHTSELQSRQYLVCRLL